MGLVCGLVLSVAGCSPDGESSGRRFLSIGTAPIGGAFAHVGGTLAEVLNRHLKSDRGWDFQTQGTKGSQENIRRLDKGELDFALSNAAITYFAARGEASWERPQKIMAVMTLAPNVAMFITKKDSGVQTIGDLKGKRVVVGPSGAGFKMFLEPILKAHNVSYDDFDPLHSSQSGAVDMIADGNASAAFLGGAVPTAAVTQACSAHDIHFVPYDAGAKARLIEEYAFFEAATIARDKYSDLEADFDGLNVGSMHVITRADLEDEVVYQVTKTLYEKREEIIQAHPVGRVIEKRAAMDTGVPFHPGALRFYAELGR